jgi:cytidylate kinase
VIAIDGPAGAGKSAVGRRVAEALGLPFVDSGAFYRAVALLSAERGVAPDDYRGLTAIAAEPGLRAVGDRIFHDDRDLTDQIHNADINDRLAKVARTAAVRVVVNAKQRALAREGVVMVGRDIGTIVFPDADFKFFLTASLEERVRRRMAQFERRGEPVDPETMRREVAERDASDAGRTVAPMKPAEDAVLIDTDPLSVDEVVAEIVERVRAGVTDP